MLVILFHQKFSMIVIFAKQYFYCLAQIAKQNQSLFSDELMDVRFEILKSMEDITIASLIQKRENYFQSKTASLCLMRFEIFKISLINVLAAISFPVVVP
jgi:hypothetical protein